MLYYEYRKEREDITKDKIKVTKIIFRKFSENKMRTWAEACEAIIEIGENRNDKEKESAENRND